MLVLCRLLLTLTTQELKELALAQAQAQAQARATPAASPAPRRTRPLVDCSAQALPAARPPAAGLALGTLQRCLAAAPTAILPRMARLAIEPASPALLLELATDYGITPCTLLTTQRAFD